MKTDAALAQLRKEGLTFLRGLIRVNKADPAAAREWFQQNKAVYEAELKRPMLAIIARVTEAMMEFAPDHVRPAEKCFFRIYRDTRFSSDKRPYKEHVAAWFAHGSLEKTSGAGFYFHISPKEVIVAAGVYMPEKEQLAAIRHWMLEHHADFRKAMRSRAVAKVFTEFEGNPLTRTPKGFPADHPADDLIRCRQFGVSATLDARAAFESDFAQTLARHFEVAAPLVAMLNEPIVASLKPRGPALFGLPDGRKTTKTR